MMRTLMLAVWVGCQFIWFVGVSSAEPPVTAPSPIAQPAGSHDLLFTMEAEINAVDGDFEAARKAYEAEDWEQAIALLVAFNDQNLSKHHTDARFMLAESYVQSHQYDEARNIFAELIAHAPDYPRMPRIRFRLGEIALLRGKTVEAQRLLEAFCAAYPEDELNAYALPYLGGLLANCNDIDNAKQRFEEAVRSFPDGPMTRKTELELALLEYRTNNYSRARTTLKHLVETDQHTDTEIKVTAKYWLATIDLKTGDIDQATRGYEEIVDDSPAANVADDACFYLAVTYQNQGKPSEARKYYQRLRHEWPTSDHFEESILGELRLLRESNEPELGRQVYQVLVDRRPSHAMIASARQLLGETLLKSQRFDELVELLQPTVSQPMVFDTDEARQQHDQDLYLMAIAKRGLGDFRTAQNLLGRIRLQHHSSQFQQRILLARSETYLANKDYISAATVASDSLDRFPQGTHNEQMRHDLVVSLVGAGRWDEAKLKSATYFEQHPWNETSLASLGVMAEAAFEREEFELAHQLFVTLKEQGSDDDSIADAISGLAWIATTQGNPSSAAVHFEELIRRFPDLANSDDVTLSYAQTLQQLGRHDQALELLSSRFDVDETGSIHRTGAFELAKLMRRQGKLDGAVEILERLLDDDANSDGRDAYLYTLGMARQEQHDDVGAGVAFESLANEYQASQHWSEALYRLAEIAGEQSRRSIADQYLQRIVEANRDRVVVAHALYLQGRLLSEQSDWERSSTILQRLMTEYPESPLVPLARYGVAESYYQRGMYSQAEELFGVLATDTETHEPWRANIPLRQAQILVTQKRYAEAIKVAETFETRFPKFGRHDEVQYTLGRCFAARAEFSKARACYQRVIDSDTVNADVGVRETAAMAEWMIGESYFHQKEFDQAIKAYSRLQHRVAFPKWQAAGLLQTGKCLEKLSEYAAAAKKYEQVVDEFGGSLAAQHAIARLQTVKSQQALIR